MPRSTYSKLLQVLVTSESIGPKNISELAIAVQERKPDAFAIFRRDGTGKIVKSFASTESIRRNIRFAVALELLEADGNKSVVHLTDLGRKALEGERYRSVLGQAVVNYLDNNKDAFGFDFEDIHRAIETQTAPSRQDIQSQLNPVMSDELFRKVLHLLATCERIKYRDKRIYSL